MKATNSQRLLLRVSLSAVVLLLRFASAAIAAEETNSPPLSDYIRPLVGTQGEGNTYPGPMAPFGMVQPGPDTCSEKFCGYDHADPMIYGFSMTHLSGTGWWDLGDFLFMPGFGKPQFDPGTPQEPRSGYQSAISHQEETASAGYYKVKLQDYNTWVELTASDRAVRHGSAGA